MQIKFTFNRQLHLDHFAKIDEKKEANKAEYYKKQSEGYTAIKMNRKSISIELKESYFKINASNHKAITEEKNSVLTLFDLSA